MNFFFNPLSPRSDKNLISPFSTNWFKKKKTGHENKGNDHQTGNVLMFNQILSTSNIRNNNDNNNNNNISALGALEQSLSALTNMQLNEINQY